MGGMMNAPNKRFSFSGRKKARRYALQSLYAWGVSGNTLSDIETDTLREHAQEKFDTEYFHILLHAVPMHLESIESMMRPYLNRKLEEVGLIELTILRISIYELQERLDIPYKVVINEGLELAKTFAAPESYKFINGVLDKVARALRPEGL